MPPSEYRKEMVERYASTHGAHFAERDRAWYDARARYFEHRVRRHLPGDKGAPILDLACGAGELLYWLKGAGHTGARGIDLSEEQLSQARKMGVDNVSREDLLSHLRKNPGHYALIVASHIVEHLSKAEVIEALAAMGKALRPGGRLVVLTPNAGSPMGLPYSFGDFTHEIHFSAMSLAQVAAMAGLPILDLGGVRPAGLLKAAAWFFARKALGVFIGDRRMRYGDVLEPEIIGVFGAP